MVKARSEYKVSLRKARYEYDKNKTDKFVHARYKNAKQYWNMLKKGAGIKKPNIDLNIFEQYFKTVNNPDSRFYNPDDDILHLLKSTKVMN